MALGDFWDFRPQSRFRRHSRRGAGRVASTLVTHLGHRPASHVAVAKLFLTSIKVVVRADTMPSPEPRVRHEAAGISRRSWGRDGCVAACRARTTASALSTRWRADYRCRKQPPDTGFDRRIPRRD